jgi:hypothetical protein
MNRSQSARGKWARIIDEQRTSGLPVSVFCRQQSVPASSFFAWRRKLVGRRAAEFVEVAVAGQADRVTDSGDHGERGAGVAIDLSGGRRRVIVGRGFDRQLLLDVIDALEAKPCTLERRS